MGKFVLGFVVGLVTLPAVFFLVAWLGLFPALANSDPPGWEKAVAQMSLNAYVSRHAPHLTNPVSATDENLLAGMKIFKDACSGCHGDLEPGKGGSAAALIPAPPQFSSVGSDFTEAQIFWVAKHGIRRSGMFVNGQWDSDERLWQVSAFIKRIRSLPPNVRAAVLAPTPK